MTTALPEPTEAQRLRADGVPVRLGDGRIWPLRFGLDALVELEDRYGSMEDVSAELDRIMKAPRNPGMMRALRDVLVPGFIEAADDAGYPRDKIARLLDPSEIHTYLQAFEAAMRQAFPQQSQAPATGPGSPPASVAGRGKGASRSRGASGTGSPQ